MDVTSDFIKVCEQAARAGGQELLSMRGRFNVQEKAPADLLTDADLASQRAVFETISLAFPEHRLVGEESREEFCSPATGYTWIVDPLDGTTNYVHNLENYCVSVALHDSTGILAGVVYDPVRDHCYRASRGEGAYLNDTAIRASNVSAVGDALIAASFSPRVPRDSPEIERFLRVLTTAQALRRLGSAALNLCYVASGKLDAYWATSLHAWDIAAGILIVNEAGGCVADLDDGGPVSLERPRIVATGSRQLNKELQDIFRDVDQL